MIPGHVADPSLVDVSSRLLLLPAALFYLAKKHMLLRLCSHKLPAFMYESTCESRRRYFYINCINIIFKRARKYSQQLQNSHKRLFLFCPVLNHAEGWRGGPCMRV